MLKIILLLMLIGAGWSGYKAYKAYRVMRDAEEELYSTEMELGAAEIEQATAHNKVKVFQARKRVKEIIKSMKGEQNESD